MAQTREKFATQVNSEILKAVRTLAEKEGRQLQALVDEALGTPDVVQQCVAGDELAVAEHQVLQQGRCPRAERHLFAIELHQVSPAIQHRIHCTDSDPGTAPACPVNSP